ncbi:hypothetical protein CONLIGDRAFT_629464 [Coniochaeta ligniaria NRRL 30616]|uniref:Uncharacterized protein n=1 Tax=Coniochaeta ligniaria NRRL 30616 TaxID=1408157 RepID=A0A1J7IVP6_9PEZI|nr:hypothetical protein CONLIGDRAFT_629464 [Coniochaeta ligniaria NRRL 30616]
MGVSAIQEQHDLLVDTIKNITRGDVSCRHAAFRPPELYSQVWPLTHAVLLVEGLGARRELQKNHR